MSAYDQMCQQCRRQPVAFAKTEWMQKISPGPGVCMDCGLKNLAASCLDDGPDATAKEIHENEQSAAFFLSLVSTEGRKQGGPPCCD